MSPECNIKARIPVSTYRLQFNRHFRFTDAKAIVPYLNALGISDIYSSPYFKAREGSLHGYDIVDHSLLNPEIGSEKEYNEMIDEIQSRGMGQILDIVPNHMCIASRENSWWMDVLENGLSSIFADFFDIDWEPVKKELKDKILLPVLGDQYGNVLENKEIQVVFENGSFFIYYYDNKFPIAPETYISILQHRIEIIEQTLSHEDPAYCELLSIITALNHLPPYRETDNERIAERYREKEIIKRRILNLYNESSVLREFIDENMKIFNGLKGDPESFNLLDAILNNQVYRLSHWRVATDEINYRRFFDINELGAIRVENIAVFEETHKLIFRLIKEGKVTGLRIDHPDGLYNPSEYFHRLQRRCFVSLRTGIDESQVIESELMKEYYELLSSYPNYKPFYIIGEKILGKGERMPDDWPIFSTTGYAFLNILNGIFVDTANAGKLDEIYTRFIKSDVNLSEIVYEKKKLIMQTAMSSEVRTLAHYLNYLSEKNRHTRDFTLSSLREAMIEVIACFPVYRTYIDTTGVNERDRRYVEHAVYKAKRRNPVTSESVFDFLKAVLLLDYPTNLDIEDIKEWQDVVMRFQQITGPVMAKGVEDTTFYVYNRLVSLNEVGGNPERLGTPLEAFHGQNIERSKNWPHALIATSTHDTKRGEDLRARINIISEIPDEWKECILRWKRLNKKKKIIVDGQSVPDLNEEYLLYQTLAGAWPVSRDSDEEHEIFKKRMKEYMLKAIRESKVNTSWINPNHLYEEAVLAFIDGILSRNAGNLFLIDFEKCQERISNLGMFNSLSQTLLQITSPGVPDFYQGTELWDFSLVDPDNRRPVDYTLRTGILEELRKREASTLPSEIARELTLNKINGKVKLYLIYKALNYRRDKRELFEEGDYVPIEAAGVNANHVVSFARISGSKNIIVIAPRFYSQLVNIQDMLPLGEVWNGSSINVPFAVSGEMYRNIFTEEIVHVSMNDALPVISLNQVMINFPVALLEKIS